MTDGTNPLAEAVITADVIEVAAIGARASSHTR
jgi:hypothetical protein